MMAREIQFIRQFIRDLAVQAAFDNDWLANKLVANPALDQRTDGSNVRPALLLLNVIDKTGAGHY